MSLFEAALEKVKDIEDIEDLNELLTRRHALLHQSLEQMAVDIEEGKVTEVTIPPKLLFFRAFMNLHVGDLECLVPGDQRTLRQKFVNYCVANYVAAVEVMLLNFSEELDLPTFDLYSFWIRCSDEKIDMLRFLLPHLSGLSLPRDVGGLVEKLSLSKNLQITELLLSDARIVERIKAYIGGNAFYGFIFNRKNAKLFKAAGFLFNSITTDDDDII